VLNAYTTYLVLEAVRGLGLGLIVVAPIFRIEVAGFGPLELVLAGTALEVAYFASEVPTGVLADTYSRRLSVICGAIVMGAAWVLEGSWPVLWPIMIAQALLGAGWTFFSGASEAWIAGEVGDDRAAHAIVRGKQANLGATVVGMFAGAALGAMNLRYPVLAAGASHLALAAFLLTAMGETGFQPEVHASRRAALASTFKGGTRAIRRSPILVLIIAAVFFGGAASEGVDRLWEAHLWVTFDLQTASGASRLYVFAAVGAGATLLSVVTISYARRFVVHESDRALPSTAAVVAVVVGAGTVAFGLAPALPVAIAVYWAVRIARNVGEPVYAVWVVRNAPPELRATVISMEGQSHAIGEIASGPGLGFVGRAVSIPAALVASGLLQALALPFLLRAALRRAAPVAPEAEPLTPDL
jgi:DHA3 family tetracycline resistance protein-like MFS transporter